MSTLSRSTSRSHSRKLSFPGRLFIVLNGNSNCEAHAEIKSLLVNHGGWEPFEIDVKDKPYIREEIERHLPPGSKLQTPSLFVNSQYIGDVQNIRNFQKKTDFKYELEKAKMSDAGPMLQIYKRRNDFALLRPQNLYFPPESHDRLTVFRLSVTNLHRTPVAFKMKTNSASSYSVHPKHGFLKSNQSIRISVTLKTGYSAQRKDKFRICGLPLPYFDESYENKIDTLFHAEKEKVINQTLSVIVDEADRPENLVIQYVDNKLEIQYSEDIQEDQDDEEGSEGKETPQAYEKTSSEKSDTDITRDQQKELSTEEEEESSTEETEQDIPKPKQHHEGQSEPQADASGESSTTPHTDTTLQAETKEEKEEEKEKNPPHTEHAKPDKEEEPQEKKPETKPEKEEKVLVPSPSTPRVTTDEVKKKATKSVDSEVKDIEEEALASLSEQTREEARSREKESKTEAKEKSIDVKAHERLKKDYKKVLQEIKTSMDLVKSLEKDKKTLSSELEEAHTEITRLTKQMEDQAELRRRRPTQETEEKDTAKTESKSTEKVPAVPLEADRGYPLMMVCVIAIICFLLGNVLS